MIEDARQEREGDRGEHPDLSPEGARPEDVDQPQQEPSGEHPEESEGHRGLLEERVILLGEVEEREHRLHERGVLVVVGPVPVDHRLLGRRARVLGQRAEPRRVLTGGVDVEALVAAHADLGGADQQERHVARAQRQPDEVVAPPDETMPPAHGPPSPGAVRVVAAQQSVRRCGSSAVTSTRTSPRSRSPRAP